MSAAPSDLRIAQRFVDWLAQETGNRFVITAGPDPPDFLLDSENEETWLELSDIYSSNEEAKLLNTPGDGHITLTNSDDAMVLRMLGKLSDKLSKLSYSAIFEKRGNGTLLLTCQYVAFDENVLLGARDALRSFTIAENRGFFRTAYFDYRMPNGKRFFEVIYQS